MHRIVVLALEGVIAFELGIAPRIFGSATGKHDEPLYEVITCTLDGPVNSDAGLIISARHGAEALDSADTVIIPPSHSLGPIREQGSMTPPLAAALARIPPGTRIVSICTASYMLAAAGLLDGRRATTHWREAEHFRQTFPAVDLDPDVLFVDDGDVCTSAGAAAGIDLCLHLVRRDHGSEVANKVARRCIVPPWRDGGQAQYIEHPVPGPSLTTTAPTRAWALQRLHRPLPLPEIAAHAQMSVRTFTRRFRAEVGMTAGQWLTLQRIELARHLLESSDLPIDHVASQAGFGSPSALRHHLRAAIGVAPATYRRTFHGSGKRTSTG